MVMTGGWFINLWLLFYPHYMERNRTKPWQTMASIARPPSFPQVDCPFNQIPCTYCGKVGHLRSKCRDAPKDRAGTAGRDWLWSFSLFQPPVSFKHGLGNPKSLNWTCLNGETHQTERGLSFSNPYYQGTDSYLSESLSWKVLRRDLCEQTGSSFHC